MTVMPGGRSFPAEQGQTLLEAALAAGFFPHFECRGGACGNCRSRIVDGRVDHGAALLSTLTQQQRDEGGFLFCCATPLSDLAIEGNGMEVPGEIRVKRVLARVGGKRLFGDVAHVRLELPSNRRMLFEQGQSVDVLLAEGRRRTFPLVNPPGDGSVLEIEVRRGEDDFSRRVFGSLRTGEPIRVEGPRHADGRTVA